MRRRRAGRGPAEPPRALQRRAVASGGARQGAGPAPAGAGGRRLQRSEEHTSELQSLMRISYAVFCLKKKKTIRCIKRNTHCTEGRANSMTKPNKFDDTRN